MNSFYTFCHYIHIYRFRVFGALKGCRPSFMVTSMGLVLVQGRLKKNNHRFLFCLRCIYQNSTCDFGNQCFISVSHELIFQVFSTYWSRSEICEHRPSAGPRANLCDGRRVTLCRRVGGEKSARRGEGLAHLLTKCISQISD